MANPFLAFRARQVLPYLGVALASVVLAGYGSIDIRQPFHLRGDHIVTLSAIKTFIDGGGFWLNESVGYPGTSFDFSYKMLFWLLSRITDNPFAVLHATYAIGLALVAICCLASLRRLGLRMTWLVAAASIVFTVSPHLAWRASAHDYLVLCYGVPLGASAALLVWSIASWDDARRYFSGGFIIVALLVSGTSGLYYGFFTAMFAVVVGAASSMAKKHPAPILAALASAAMILCLLLLVGFGPNLLDLALGCLPQVTRAPIEQYYYGLQIAEALHVYADFGLFRHAFEYYKSIMGSIGGANGLFEWPGPFLTTVILLSPLLVLAAPRGGRSPLVFFAAGLTSFGLIYAARGGLSFLFAESHQPGHSRPAAHPALPHLLRHCGRGRGDRTCRRWMGRARSSARIGRPRPVALGRRLPGLRRSGAHPVRLSCQHRRTD
jgi:hypothetical protein